METKLTLRLDSEIIAEAKKYAGKRKTSVSKLVKNYLESMVSRSGGDEHISPLVKSLSGVIEMKKEADYKTAYKKHIADKYLKKNG